ncbi:FAD synthetase family protein [Ureibacillus sp. FSL K6-8385]|uniref:FAD synthase n=1 Tax=Ureibacillus terrenus TaxID=118246 RepID=A0A540V1Z1_9BACL|nr:FAD synthetase family protein [Ureibacillus terrenus]MED3661058.1 FAD synthetase family protein [Ureibacillus terrenus]MED3763344.1 FAD synthetase family protein [Ureibacillus terrenus]TQE90759.1 FAD synthetase family protein [Ureibacillus terrenus]
MKVVHIHHGNLQEIAETAPKAAMALGYFDGIHLGHQKVIQCAKKKADEKGLLTAVLSFSQHPKSVLFSEDVMYLEPVEQKIEKLKRLGVDIFYLADFTKELARLMPDEFLEKYIVALNAKEIVCGFDYTYGAKAMGNVKTLEDFTAKKNIGLTVVNELKWKNEKISSTLIRQHLKERKIREIQYLLGDFYKIKYCQKDGVLPYYTLPDVGTYKVLIEDRIECLATVKCKKYIQIHYETTKLPSLLTIKWLDSYDRFESIPSNF